MKTPSQFYKELGAKKLAARKSAIRTKKELSYLKKHLKKKEKILDLACGYGRFTIPLAKQGYTIEGIDISPNLIEEAKKTAKKEKLSIKFQIGDMRNLPYRNESFDSVICMWSAFIEIYKEKDQLRALSEMMRVLSKGGFVFLDLPKPQRIVKSLKTKRKDVKPQKIIQKGRIVISTIEGVEAVPMYLHNKTTIIELLRKAKLSKYKLFVDDFGGRKRLLVFFWK
jgi:ubiquinone/menaquinone biosynthesis C-methylase UbiE